MTKILLLGSDRFEFSDDVIAMFEKKVTKFGNGAKIDCPKEYLGKTVYVVVKRE